jgi:hypothetical protein
VLLAEAGDALGLELEGGAGKVGSGGIKKNGEEEGERGRMRRKIRGVVGRDERKVGEVVK